MAYTNRLNCADIWRQSRPICSLLMPPNLRPFWYALSPFSLPDAFPFAQTKRDSMFFHDWACVSYMLDPRFRGAGLTPSKRRSILAFICEKGWAAICGDVQMPMPDEFVNFVDARDPYMVPYSLGSMNPMAFWSMFRDTPPISLWEFGEPPPMHYC